MMDKLNCPNCGAPITETKCPYCGTVFYDFTALSFDKPTYIKTKVYENQLIIARVMLTDFTIVLESDTCGRLDISMILLPDDRGVHLERMMKTC